MEGYFNYITKPFGSNEHLIQSHIERDSSKSILKEPWSLYFSQALFMALNFGGAYIRRGLSTEGNSRFKIDWASLAYKWKEIYRFCYVFQVQAPGGLIFGGVYFRNFTVFGELNVLPNSNLPGLRFFAYYISFIMWHSYLNCMQIPSKKYPRFTNLCHT